MRVEGNLESEALGGVLRRIGDARATGILTLQGDEDIIGVTFLDGEIVSVDAVNQSPEEATGRLLVERGLLTREALATLLAEHESGGPRMQEAAIEQGLIDPSELRDALRERSLRLCGQALAWRHGRYRFYPNDEIAYEPGMTAITVTELLAVEAASSLPTIEDGAGTSPPLSPPAPAVERDRAWSDDDEADAEEAGWLAKVGRRLPVAAPERLAWTLALAVALTLAFTAWRSPASFYFPLGSERLADRAFDRQQRSAFYLKVDRAAKAFYLLTGSFPESLPDLVGPGLLAESDLGLSHDRPLAYAEAPVSYLVLVRDAAGSAESHRTETVAGHFLLDPDFVAPEVVEAPPLVLLD